MALIQKLSIRGIRSFDPDEDQIIEFYMPLTMIVGANGCGKTTVIECLRYACTGLLPPNARNGQTFVHDPKMCGISEVKAQIKLRLKVRGSFPVMVVRSLQLSQKKSGLQFKALDGVLRYVNPEDGVTTSSGIKCTDLDKQVPMLMGVSRAILESVIFCHQEESSWPLQEGAVLKKKFDDIFESARYTKALEVIKSTKMELSNRVKDYNIDLATLTAYMETAESIQNDLSSHEEKCDRASESMSTLDATITGLQDEMSRYQAMAQQAAVQRCEIESLSSKIREISIHIQEKEAHIAKLYDEASDNELNQYLSDFDAEIMEQRNAFDIYQKRQIQAKNRLSEILNEKNRLHASLGGLEVELNEQNRRLKACHDCAANLVQKYNITLDSDNMDELLANIRQKATDFEEELDKMRSVSRLKEDDLANNVSRLQAEQRTNHAAKVAKDAEIKEASEEVNSLENARQQQTRQTSQGNLSVAKERMETARNLYEAFKKSHDSGEVELQVRNLESEYAFVKIEVDQVQKALQAASENEEDQRDLASRLRNISIDQEQLRQDTFNSRPLIDFIGESFSDVSPALFENIDRKMRNLKMETNESLRSAQEKEVEYKEAQAGQLTLQRHAQQRLLKIMTEKKKFSSNVLPILGSIIEKINAHFLQFSEADEEELFVGDTSHRVALNKDDIVGALSVLSQESKLIEKYIGYSQGQKHCIEYFLKKAEADVKKNRLPECRCCERKMNKEEYAIFVETCRKRTKEDDGGNLLLNERSSFVKDMAKELETLLPEFIRMKEFESEEAIIRQDKDNATRESATLEERIQESDRIVKQHSERCNELEKAIGQLHTLMAESNRIESHERQAEELQKKLTSWATSSIDGNNLKETLANKLKQKEKIEFELNSARSEHHSHMSKMLGLTNKKNDTEKDFEAEKTKSERLESVKQKLTDGQLHVAKLASELKDLDIRALPLKQELENAMYELERARSLNRSAIDKVQNSLQSCQMDAKDLLTHVKATSVNFIKDIINRKMSAQKEIESADKESEQLESLLKESIRDEKIAQQDIDAQAEKRKCIEDNLSLRALQKEMSAFENERVKLTKNLKKGEGEQAVRHVEHAQRRMAECKENRAERQGELKALRDQINDLKTKLRSGPYMNIQEKRRRKLIDSQVTTMAVSDLEKYWQALDKALMQYHHIKIAEINKIVKELWQITYKGRDIDCIEIVSGEEGASSRAARSYNYRVVMKKGTTSMEMKGRCSAGQRVLASIVIRLALAETFCINCGILALDEPTTNLDYENKEGLAKALASIIAQRSQYNNFQLIAITHDEDFVSKMRTQLSSIAGFNMPESYWCIVREKVSETEDRFCSRMKMKMF